MKNNETELLRLRQIKALKSAVGSWADKDHPELKRGAAMWVSEMRKADEERFRKMRSLRRRPR
jgi:hypothetical protein